MFSFLFTCSELQTLCQRQFSVLNFCDPRAKEINALSLNLNRRFDFAQKALIGDAPPKFQDDDGNNIAWRGGSLADYEDIQSMIGAALNAKNLAHQRLKNAFTSCAKRITTGFHIIEGQEDEPLDEGQAKQLAIVYLLPAEDWAAQGAQQLDVVVSALEAVANLSAHHVIDACMSCSDEEDGEDDIQKLFDDMVEGFSSTNI